MYSFTLACNPLFTAFLANIFIRDSFIEGLSVQGPGEAPAVPHCGAHNLEGVDDGRSNTHL